jgi:hypothetical protein
MHPGGLLESLEAFSVGDVILFSLMHFHARTNLNPGVAFARILAMFFPILSRRG